MHLESPPSPLPPSLPSHPPPLPPPPPLVPPSHPTSPPHNNRHSDELCRRPIPLLSAEGRLLQTDAEAG